jgi:ABC-type lipoprotein release transport system permease subunit
VEVLEGLKRGNHLCTKRVNYKLILNIAFHLLRARLKQTIVAVGVTFSIAMFIALVSFMNGLNEMLDGLMLINPAYSLVQ